MRWTSSLVLITLLATSALRTTAADEEDPGDRIQRAVAAARDRVLPALVNIRTVTQRFRDGRATRVLAAGSGVMVSPAGHVVTNYHVAENAVRLTCVFPSGEKVDADVLAHDPLTDLSILALRLAEREDPARPVEFAAIGNSDALAVGDQVLAMGNPRSLSSSVTLGIVASTNRVFKSFAGTGLRTLELSEGQPTGLFTRWIQHDALIQQGNSGGPLVNLQGEVIGINELGGGGMSFAIPSNVVKTVLTRALTFGEIRRGWLGVTVHPVEPLDRQHGALLASVLADGPAGVAGLRPGDVVLSVGSVAAQVQRFEDVPSFYADVADLPIGSTQKVVFERAGERGEVGIKIDAMQKFLGEERAFPIWGVSAMAITPPMAFAAHYPDARGALLTGLRSSKPPEVARPPLRRGDVVLEIGGESVTGLDEFAALQGRFRKTKDLLVRFRRGRLDMVTALDMTKKPPRRVGRELAKAWLGARTQVMTPEVSRALGMKGQKGYRVSWVLPGTEARKAGLQAGDVITALDGEVLNVWRRQDAELLQRRIEDMDIGSEVTLQVLRDGKEEAIEVTLEETPQTAAGVRKVEDEFLEYEAREITYMDKVEKRWPLDVEGLIVAEVVNGGWAHVAGLRSGDLLLTIQDQPIRSIADFKKAKRVVAEARPQRVRMFVRRDRVTRFVFVEPDWPGD